MDLERPNFNTEPSESEQELITPDSLQEQARLPMDRWNEEFRQLIKEKIRENQQEENDEIEESPEVLRERTFKRYTEGLGLNENSLRDKKILDIGSSKGEFVKSLIEKGISSEAYGIDTEFDEAAIENKFKDYITKGNFEEDFPVQNVDYVVSVGAVSNGIWGGEETMDIRRIIEKSLTSLKEDGEIRIYPIQEAAKATPLEGLEKSQQKWNELLTEISETQKVEYRVEPRNIKVTGNSNDIILESVLIIRRKKD
jgi:hypothetical protein